MIYVQPFYFSWLGTRYKLSGAQNAEVVHRCKSPGSTKPQERKSPSLEGYFTFSIITQLCLEHAVPKILLNLHISRYCCHVTENGLLGSYKSVSSAQASLLYHHPKLLIHLLTLKGFLFWGWYHTMLYPSTQTGFSSNQVSCGTTITI